MQFFNKNYNNYFKWLVPLLFVLVLFAPNFLNRTAIAIIVIVGCIGSLFILIIPRFHHIHFPVFFKFKVHRETISEPMDMDTFLWRQVSYQITGKLKSAYPDATWEFDKKPKITPLLNGHTLRIRTFHTAEYNYAEIYLNRYGELALSMMTIESLLPNPRTDASDESNQVDPASWYSLIGKPYLFTLISDLQARGHQKLLINENGEIFIQNGDSKELKGTLDHFPPKPYWAALTDIFIRDELNAVESDNTVELSWT